MPIVTDPPVPSPTTHHATYRADVRHMVGEVVGPSQDGRLFKATAPELLDDGRTRVKFEQVTAAELAASLRAQVGAAA